MKNFTVLEATAAIINAAVAFRQKYEADAAAASLDSAVAGKAEFPETMEESDWWEQFVTFLEPVGLSKFTGRSANPDAQCFAGLKIGEPSFTLRGQDITATVVLRNWIEMQSLSPENDNMNKVDKAEAIYKKMVDFAPQKWPD